ncbi:rhamnulokinase [Bythopirellula polymerisocia]|uniref:Rhamnulokinase n=1 Tax=Bythopirellula polymerisocia TaxID=2528003 RepID=A0A5C6D3L7_9BACT|nr:rhamnulokinase family protein [Bythopirellula polymerisocia]TWU30247.1 Rhamnulokinase [Bythopirellula polymerisocia]
MSFAHLAIDLGASSGRAIVGLLDGSPLKLRLEEVHRFEHLPCPTPVGPVWDLTGIWLEILTGLGAAAKWCRENGAELKSVGVDTWGVDWALLGKSGEVLGLPHCYRDPQNEAACQRVLEQMGGFEKLYERTGIQLMPFNTLFQVAARYHTEPKLFDAAERLVFLPDLFHNWLSGELQTERTIASTSSMLDVETGEWDTELLEKLGLPTDILGSIVEPGTVLGTLRAEIAQTTNASAKIQVIAPAAHDTGSAVAAVPATVETNWAYLSSGTWSLLGVELAKPITSEVALSIPLTNERGVDGTIRLLKNIAGLWLVQELRRELQQAGESQDFAQMVEEARRAEPGRTIIDPNYAEFASPGNMSEKIRQFAKKTRQPEPETIGQLVRCALESLALCYDHTLQQLESVLGKSIGVLHIVGGGIQNDLLNEFATAAVGRSVITGPVEATAIGNLLVQAMGSGELSGLPELREIVANSFPRNVVKPDAADHWADSRGKFAELITK